MTQAQAETTHKVPEPARTPPTIDDLINSTNIQTNYDDQKKVSSISEDSQEEKDDDIVETPINQPKETSHEEGQKRNAEKEKEEVKSSSEADLDEYGNEIPKPRTYTEEEVNRMMRERFNRGNQVQQQQTQIQQQASPQQVQQAADGFVQNPNSADSWEVQLNKYIDTRLEQREKSLKTQEWQQKEFTKQKEFEHKFSTGVERYKDFREVAGSMPITDTMMLATRDMKDPAAFIYAASKQHPAELKRISELADGYQQAAEIGRLEERMRKGRNITKAAPPLRSTSSDVSAKTEPKPNIDHTIHNHAKRKMGRR